MCIQCYGKAVKDEHNQEAFVAAIAPGEYACTPEFVKSLTGPTAHFLCPLTANTYNIDFVNVKICAVEEGSETLLFEMGGGDDGHDLPETLDDSSRFIRFQFGSDFLDFRTISATREFTIGDTPLKNFRMIERHYFGGQLIRSYDFILPFVIPNTKNTWEVIYVMPELSQEWRDALISAPWETKSDTFYFADGQLIMHNRAEYSYSDA